MNVRLDSPRIPTPFPNLPFGKKDANQPKRKHSLEGLTPDDLMQFRYRLRTDERGNHLSSAPHLCENSARHSNLIPIQQCERNPALVGGNPGSAVAVTGVHCLTPMLKCTHLQRQTHTARDLLVTI